MLNTNFKGLLFIGDPHVCSKRVGRRKDNYLDSVLGKLDFCAQYCCEHQLYPIVLGDLFHRNDDNNLVMLNRLIQILKKFPIPPVVLEGNHDKEMTTLTERDSLSLLALTGVVRVINDPGLIDSISIDGVTLNLHGAPYGSPLPEKLDAADDWAINVLVSHHDLAFGSSYPGALPLKEIKGALMVVNGHMHDTKKSVQIGETLWHNPGNIEPLSVDLAHHVPKVWHWAPGQGNQLEGVLLPHGADLFDLTGIAIEAHDNPAEAVRAIIEESQFAKELSLDAADDAARTDDLSILEEDLSAVVAASAVSEATALLLTGLFSKLRQESLS